MFLVREYYFPVVFVSPRVEYHFLSVWIKSYEVTIQMKVIECYFPVVLFIITVQDDSSF